MYLHLKMKGFKSIIMVLQMQIDEGIPNKILLKQRMRDPRLINMAHILKCNFLNPVNINFE
jgi:hypothetical protein